MTAKQEQAIAFMEAGYNILPFTTDKNFFLVEWKPLQKTPATKEQIQAWWTRWPDANVGIITGEMSNLTVIDFDIKEDGKLSAEQIAMIKKLPPTLTILTPSDGRHLYYRYNQKIKTTSYKELDIDIRNDGGLIGGYDNYCEYTKKKIEGIVKGWYRIDESKPQEPAELDVEVYNAIFHVATVAERKQFEKKDWVTLPLDYRNEYFFKYACSLFSKGLSKGEVADYFQLKYEKLPNKVDFTLDEVMTSVNSAAKFEKADIKEMDMSGYKGEDELILASEIYKEVIAQKPREKIPTPFVRLNNLMGGGFLPNDFIICTGATKAGKTLFLNQIVNSWDSRTLFLALEDGIAEQIRREYEKYGIAQEPKCITYRDRPKDGFTLDWIKIKIKEGIQKFNVNKVVIDNLDWIEDGENYKKNKTIIRDLKQLCDECNIIVILVVHIRGESAYAFGTKRPDIQTIKGGSHIYQMGTKCLIVWRVMKASGEDKTEAGYTKVILALDRHSGNNDKETQIIYDHGKFLEISDEEYKRMRDRLNNKVLDDF